MPIADAEELVRSDRGGSEKLRLGREREGIAVPTDRAEDAGAIGPERISGRGGRECDVEKADFLARIWHHFSSERLGHQLCAEAKSQDRLLLGDGCANEAHVVAQIRKLVGFIHAHVAAAENERIKSGGAFGQRVASPGMRDLKRDAMFPQDSLKQAGSVGWRVLDE